MSDVIEVIDLVKTYGTLNAVDSVGFTVGAGEVFSFLGPNGAGKTTTVEILEGLRHASRGSVRVLGHDPWREGGSLQRRIGVIPQDFHFFPKLTPGEAIGLYAGLFGVRPRVTELLDEVGLTDKAEARYDTLSGGQHQKLGLALALVNDPELFFLDEPTTGLDPQARRAIWKVVERLKGEGRTIFLTTHYLEEAQQLSDRIAIIDRGKIIATGPPEGIIEKFGQGERLRLVAGADLAAFLRARLAVPIAEQDHTLEVPVRSKDEAIALLELVRSSGLPWQSFSTVTDTLEDVFIRLVGRLEEGTVTDGGGKGRR